MKIYLLRHFKVDYIWDKTYDSVGFDLACSKYDTNAIIKDSKLLNITIDKVCVSELLRTKETAKALGITQNLNENYLLNEVPIKSFVNTSFRLPTSLWLFMGRLQWYLGIKRQPEIKCETQHRIDLFMGTVEADNKDCLIIGHGFYFQHLKTHLKKLNYTGGSNTYFKNGELIEFRKNF